MLAGKGGSPLWGKLLPAAPSLARGGLPLGLAHGPRVLRPVKQGQSLCWDDVSLDTDTRAYKLRREMEKSYGPGTA